ncbi:MAG: AgrD family cyclic lactone autoinducer peptide [Candidatus Sulfotelmatobacter sp.]
MPGSYSRLFERPLGPLASTALKAVAKSRTISCSCVIWYQPEYYSKRSPR